MLNRWDGRSRPRLTITTDIRPSDDSIPLAERFKRVTILPRLNTYGLPSPVSPGRIFSLQPIRDSLQRSQTAIEPRTIPIHHDFPESPPPGLRRTSTAIETRPLPPLPPAPRRQSIIEIHDQLLSWGHVCYGDAKTADALVIARSLRRHSNAPVRPSGETESPNSKATNLLTVRAIIRPRALERQSFLIQRTFDIDKLRDTIPDLIHIPKPGIPERRPNTSGYRPSPRPSHVRRRNSVMSSELLSGRGKATVSLDHESLMRDAKAVPVHLKYTRAYLPVLTALLVSGHVREGDIIYLPLPHAEAWPQTVKYIYTRQGELTRAVRENIIYLAGKA